MSEYQRDERLQRLFEVGQEIYASDIAEAIPAIESLERRLQEAEKEGLEQARLLGMSGEREADLRGKLQRAEQKIIQLESEAAVKDYALNDVLYRIETENLHWGEIDTIKDALSGGTAGRELLERLKRAEGDIDYWIRQAKISDELYVELRKKLADVCGKHPEEGGREDALKDLESLRAKSQPASSSVSHALLLIEEMRKAWLATYTYPEATQYDKHFALLQLDRIDHFINTQHGNKWWTINVEKKDYK